MFDYGKWYKLRRGGMLATPISLAIGGCGGLFQLEDGTRDRFATQNFVGIDRGWDGTTPFEFEPPKPKPPEPPKPVLTVGEPLFNCDGFDPID